MLVESCVVLPTSVALVPVRVKVGLIVAVTAVRGVEVHPELVAST
jgi:hypothetical protein